MQREISSCLIVVAGRVQSVLPRGKKLCIHHDGIISYCTVCKKMQIISWELILMPQSIISEIGFGKEDFFFFLFLSLVILAVLTRIQK